MNCFEWVCEALEDRTELRRIEARGTVRLALKEAGFSPKEVSAREMRVVIRKILVKELALRRIPDPDQLCADLVRELPIDDEADLRGATETAQSIFSRLGRLRG